MKIHFVGIGGIGVSALARYYLEKGCQVSGSDLVSSEITEALKAKGAKIFIPHRSKLGTGQAEKHKLPDLVIYSPAVPKENPELKKARKLGIKCLSYPEALGELTKKYFTIAVSGTHGKSTTCAMIGLLLIKAGFDPTVIVGTKLKEFGDSNCRVGKPIRQAQGKIQYLVIEADEHMASFLNYWPKIIVLTTIEADHLDFYKNLKNILKAFKKFTSHLPKDGILIANKDDKNRDTSIFTFTKNGRVPIFYSLKQKESEKLRKILKIPGVHNVSNALATLTVARALEIPDRISFKALAEYKGSWRRFDIKRVKINNKSLIIINDYGHHPTQIKVTLKAAREKFPKRKIWCIFQPHQYQRTYYLFKDFVKTFREAKKKSWFDKLIITDIYDVAGREKPEIKREVSSEKLVAELNKKQRDNKILHIATLQETAEYLLGNLRGGEVLIIMGAGDIYKLPEYFST